MPLGMPLQSWGAPGGIMEGVNELARTFAGMPSNVANARLKQQQMQDMEAERRHKKLVDAFSYGNTDPEDQAANMASEAGARARALDEEKARSEIDYKKGSLDVQRTTVQEAAKDRKSKMRDQMVRNASMAPIHPRQVVKSIHGDEADFNDPEVQKDVTDFDEMYQARLQELKDKAEASKTNIRTEALKTGNKIFGSQEEDALADYEETRTEKGLVGVNTTVIQSKKKIKVDEERAKRVDRIEEEGEDYINSLPKGDERTWRIRQFRRYVGREPVLDPKVAQEEGVSVQTAMQGAPIAGVDRSQEITQAMGGATAAPEPVISDADKVEMTQLMKILTKFPNHAEAKAALETYKAKYGIK